LYQAPGAGDKFFARNRHDFFPGVMIFENMGILKNGEKLRKYVI